MTGSWRELGINNGVMGLDVLGARGRTVPCVSALVFILHLFASADSRGVWSRVLSFRDPRPRCGNVSYLSVPVGFTSATVTSNYPLRLKDDSLQVFSK